MHHSKTERRMIRFRLAVLFGVAVVMIASVLALSAATPAAGAATTPYDAQENSYTNAYADNDVASEEEDDDDSTNEVRFEGGADSNASLLAQFSRDDGMHATLECESDATAVVTVEVLEGSYAGEGTYELTCGESIALPAPEEAVTLRITVEIEGEEYVRVVDYDLEGPSHPDDGERERDHDDQRWNDTNYEERFGSSAEGNASVDFHFDSDEGLTAQVECEGNVTAVVTIEVLEGSYAGESTHEVACGESIALPAPEEAVTLRITVEIEGEEFVRVIEYDPAGISIPEMGEDDGDQVEVDRDKAEEMRQRALERIRALLDGESEAPPIPEPDYPDVNWTNASDDHRNGKHDDQWDGEPDDDGKAERWDDELDREHPSVDCTASGGGESTIEGEASAHADGDGAQVEGNATAEFAPSPAVECTHDTR